MWSTNETSVRCLVEPLQRSSKVRRQESKMKTIAFFDSMGLIHQKVSICDNHSWRWKFHHIPFVKWKKNYRFPKIFSKRREWNWKNIRKSDPIDSMQIELFFKEPMSGINIKIASPLTAHFYTITQNGTEVIVITAGSALWPATRWNLPRSIPSSVSRFWSCQSPPQNFTTIRA